MTASQEDDWAGRLPARLTEIPDGLLVLGISLLCLLPIFLTPVLPSVDFYAHIVRYNALANPEAPISAENYQPNWQLLPNLGMDALGAALMKVMPPLLGAKVLAGIVILAPVLGAMALSWAIHGRVGMLNGALAGLLGYNLILFWGFANFLFGLGLALGSFALWIALKDRPWLQFALMAFLGVVIFMIHGLVFALWGIFLGAIELQLALMAGGAGPCALLRRAGRLILLAVIPVILFLQTSTVGADGGATQAIQNLAGYEERGTLWPRLMEELWERIDAALRVVETLSISWSTAWVDRGFGFLLWGLLAAGAVTGTLGIDRRLWLAVGLGFLLIGLMPPNLFGVGHLDERIPLLFLALVVSGVTVRPGAPDRLVRTIRTGLIALFPLHLVLVAWAMADAGRDYRSYLSTLKQINTRETATAAFLGNNGSSRDGRLLCKPLLFLLQLENGTAVPTFANPTQQPLRIVGPLAEAGRELGSVPTELPPAQKLERMVMAGYDTIIACGPDNQPLAGKSFRVLATGSGGWVLYGQSSP